MIAKASKDAGLLQIKKEPVQDYLFLGLATVGAMLGLNMLLELAGVTDNSAVYKALAEQQYSVNLWLGLLLYVILASFCEELLFRGVIYNCLKRMSKPLAAMLAAAFSASTTAIRYRASTLFSWHA